VHTFITSKL